MTGDQWPPLPAMTVHGDSIIQQGYGNVGKVVHGSEQRVYAAAAEELSSLVAELQNTGLLGAYGEVADERALEAAVRRDRPRVQRLLDALGAGAQKVLLDGVDSAAAPVVLEVLRRVFG